MEKKSEISMPTFKLDDFFTTQEQRDELNEEKTINIELSKIDNFKNHPFKVLENHELEELVQSIKENNLIYPVIVRKKDNGRFEMIAGHRRKRAFEILGIKNIPAKVLNLTDDEATIYMVESNLQREKILPSEKAYAYKMKYEAIKHQGKIGPMGQKLTSSEKLSEEVGESERNIRRYIRLTNLTKELLDMVDNSFLDKSPTMALRPAVELSYLTKEEQKILVDAIDVNQATPSHAQAIRLRKLSADKKLTEDLIYEIMSEEKSNQIQKIKISEDKIRRVLPKNVRINNIEDFIVKAIEYYGKHLKDRGIER